MKRIQKLSLALVVMLSVFALCNTLVSRNIAKTTVPSNKSVYIAELRIVDPPPVLSQGYKL